MSLDNVKLEQLPCECLIMIKNKRMRGKRAANYQNVGMRLVILGDMSVCPAIYLAEADGISLIILLMR